MNYVSKKDLSILQKDRIITHFPYLLELYKKYQLSLFVATGQYEFCENIVALDEYTARSEISYYELNYPRIWRIVEKIVLSNYRKRSRVSKRLTNIVANSDSPLYFGTITFTDTILSSTTQRTRRVYVRRFLKSISKNYIANIDFGDKNNREHYHCIFGCDNVDTFKQWQYGFVNVKKVRYSEQDYKRITKYTVKLVNHCVKGSAGFVIASRNKKELL